MRRQLAQVRPSDTNAATAYTNSERPWVVHAIVVANNTGSGATFSIYHDADGTTYSEATCLYFGVSLGANTTTVIEFEGGVANTNRLGSIGVKSGTGSAITYTLYGEVAGERL